MKYNQFHVATPRTQSRQNHGWTALQRTVTSWRKRKMNVKNSTAVERKCGNKLPRQWSISYQLLFSSRQKRYQDSWYEWKTPNYSWQLLIYSQSTSTSIVVISVQKYLHQFSEAVVPSFIFGCESDIKAECKHSARIHPLLTWSPLLCQLFLK